MSRPSREHALMQTAYTWAARSTCSRLHVGCVIHREGRILVQGYNGAPAGLEHCTHDCECNHDQANELHGQGHMPWCPAVAPCLRAVHAEQNAISFAARWGVGLEGAELYCTNQPCLPCAQTIINAGVEKVWFCEPYRLRDGRELLEEAGIEVVEFLDFSIPG